MPVFHSFGIREVVRALTTRQALPGENSCLNFPFKDIGHARSETTVGPHSNLITPIKSCSKVLGVRMPTNLGGDHSSIHNSSLSGLLNSRPSYVQNAFTQHPQVSFQHRLGIRNLIQSSPVQSATSRLGNQTVWDAAEGALCPRPLQRGRSHLA